jgi:hypothetical protein
MGRRDRLWKRLHFSREPSSQGSVQPLSPQPSVPANSYQRSTTTLQDSLPSPVSQQNLPLRLAIEKHYNSLPDSDKAAFKDAFKNITQDDLISKIQDYDKTHKNSSGFRPRSDSISKFLALLQRFMAGITTAIQADPAPSAIIVGAVQLVLVSAMEIVTFFNRLTEMMNRLSDYLGPITKYATMAHHSDMLRQEVADVYGDILVFCTAARRVFLDERGNNKNFVSLRTFLRVQWDPFETTFGDIEKRFKHHLDVLGCSSDALQLSVLLIAEDERKCTYIKDNPR